MQAVTIVQITPDELQTIIIDCVNACLRNYKNFESEKISEDKWFNLKELCEYIPDRPSKPTVYGWVNSSKIPVHKGGKKLRFLKSEIDAWLKEGTKKMLAESI
jgi:excisionase family DNA binding protein